MNRTTIRRRGIHVSALAEAFAVLLTVPTSAIAATPPEMPDGTGSVSPASTPYCFAGRADWGFDLVGPPPCSK